MIMRQTTRRLRFTKNKTFAEAQNSFSSSRLPAWWYLKPQMWKIIESDNFFNEKTCIPDILTKDGNACCNEIDISYYNQTPIDQFRKNNLYDFFHGIISYIWLYSNKFLNTREMEFHFSGASQRKRFDDQTNPNNPNVSDISDILNIMDAENPKTCFMIEPYRDACFGITFKRIKIVPICYCVRSGYFCNSNGPFLTSFTFEGYDEETNQWDILDERVNTNELNPSGGYSMFIVRKTDKSYSSFRIRQTEPGGNGRWGFAIAAFDIHGYPSYRCDVNLSAKADLLVDESNQSFSSKEDLLNLDIDPCINMIDFF